MMNWTLSQSTPDHIDVIIANNKETDSLQELRRLVFEEEETMAILLAFHSWKPTRLCSNHLELVFDLNNGSRCLLNIELGDKNATVTSCSILMEHDINNAHNSIHYRGVTEFLWASMQIEVLLGNTSLNLSYSRYNYQSSWVSLPLSI